MRVAAAVEVLELARGAVPRHEPLHEAELALAGTRWPARSSISSAAIPSRAARKRFSSISSTACASARGSSDRSSSRLASAWTSAAIAPTSRTVLCPSMIRTSTVP